MKRVKRWFVTNNNTGERLKGPYKHSETAGEVRSLIEQQRAGYYERRYEDDPLNMGIAWEWMDMDEKGHLHYYDDYAELGGEAGGA